MSHHANEDHFDETSTPSTQQYLKQGKRFRNRMMQLLIKAMFNKQFDLFVEKDKKINPYLELVATDVLKLLLQSEKPATPGKAGTGAYGLVNESVRFINLPGGPTGFPADYTDDCDDEEED